jgi:glycerol dehydrogenase
MLQSRPDEARRVAEFFSTVGLPLQLGQLSLDPEDGGALDVIAEGTLAFPFTFNMPRPVTADLVRSAVLDADRLGRSVAERAGEAAYRRLHRR